MPERPSRSALIDLVAFVAVLATGILMVVLHVSGATFVMVAGALSTLYTTWAVSSRRQAPTRAGRDESVAAPAPPSEQGP
ncbi:hypothetical protein [Kitasatospora sp. NPDC057015]|uniref:hypothetical protein n=1 Tax=Kitasatospora sp. NPDC057015 TaxID=3346001 RepID=UPI003637C69E